MARDLVGNEDFFKIALIAVAPYGTGPVNENCSCTRGRLRKTEEWFVRTPPVALLKDDQVASAWEQEAPDFEPILADRARSTEKAEESWLFALTPRLTDSLARMKGGDDYVHGFRRLVTTPKNARGIFLQVPGWYHMITSEIGK